MMRNPEIGRRVLITGGAGFIGSHIAEALHADGWHVVALDNLSAGRPSNLPAAVPLHVGDIRSDDDTKPVIYGAGFDAIVHCAAQTSVERSMKDPQLDHDVNVGGTERLLAAARAAGVKRFVFVSSGGAIYGETSTPATEESTPSPVSYYGMHKCEAENAVLAGARSYAILRLSNVYGHRQRSDTEGGVIAIFSERLMAGRQLEIHGDGSQLRDFVYISDVVDAARLALETEDDPVWNVASGEATSVLALARAMAQVIGQPLEIVHGPRRAGDLDRSVLSPAKLLATKRWGPPLLLREGLERILTGEFSSPAHTPYS